MTKKGQQIRKEIKSSSFVCGFDGLGSCDVSATVGVCSCGCSHPGSSWCTDAPIDPSFPWFRIDCIDRNESRRFTCGSESDPIPWTGGGLCSKAKDLWCNALRLKSVYVCLKIGGLGSKVIIVTLEMGPHASERTAVLQVCCHSMFVFETPKQPKRPEGCVHCWLFPFSDSVDWLSQISFGILNNFRTPWDLAV